MKKLFTILFLCFSVYGHSQNKKLEKGKEYFEQQQYSEALTYFRSEENKIADALVIADIKVKMAKCYFMLHQPGLAVENYKKAIQYGYNMVPDQFIDFAQALIEIAEYTEAKKILKDIDSGMFIEDILLEKCDYALTNDKPDPNIEIFSFKELPAMGSFGITYYRNNLLYIFNDEQRNLKNNSKIFGYVGRYDKTIDDLNTISFSENTNSPALDAKNEILYFSANASFISNKRSSNENLGIGGIDNLFIYELKYNRSKPTATKLPFNHVDFSCTHPCLSEDGKTMYFSSNMLGGYGEFDIYVAKKTDSGWGTPQNLGTKINSFLNEGYPFILGNYLYFSSDGHPGYGGLDIFRYNFETKEVENLGLPINSSFDDFYYIQNPANEGFLISNRAIDEGKDSIYKFIVRN
jgi:tetratricopeptide (TPR) repeat protein